MTTMRATKQFPLYRDGLHGELIKKEQVFDCPADMVDSLRTGGLADHYSDPVVDEPATEPDETEADDDEPLARVTRRSRKDLGQAPENK